MSKYIRGDLFTEKMINSYSMAKDVLDDLLANRETYELSKESFINENEVFRIYDLSKSIEDKEISEAVLATCYWYIYHNFNQEPLIFTETDDKGNEKLRMNLISDHLIKKYCIVSANYISYLYIDNRYYEDIHRLARDVVKILKDNGYSDQRKIEPIVRDILFRIKNETMKFKEFPFNKKSEYLIPVSNGVVERKNLRILLPKSPVWGFTYALPVTYDPLAPTKPIRDFINNIVVEEDRKLLVQIPSQALMQNSNFQLSYLLTGDGSNGKSTYIRLLAKLVGKQSTTAVSLQELIENRFATANLQGKLFNLYADLPKTSLKDPGKFKILTGGDLLTAEKKFADSFLFENKAVFVFSANELPQVDDGTYAFWRRWAVIAFPNKFKPSVNFERDLFTEENLSGFLNIVIEDMNRIENEGIFRSAKVDEIMDMWKMRSDSVYAFIKMRLRKSANESIPKNILWNEYNKFCTDNDFTELSKIKFRQHLEKEFPITETYVIKDRERELVIKGIAFIDLNKPIKKEEKKIETIETKVAEFTELPPIIQ
jgi:P4 family phage/plasmid primase-like protien